MENMKSDIENKELLEKGSPQQLFINYAIPSLVTVLFFGLQNLVDGIVVGNYVSDLALGGVNLILPFFSLLIVLSLIIGIGSQTLVSHGLGENNLEKAQNAMTSGFWALTFLSIVITIGMFFFATPIIKRMGADATLMPHAMGYLKGLIPFVLPVTLCFYSDAILKSLGHPRMSMFIMTFSIVLNIFLSIYFVKYVGMGTMGASLATGIAFSVGLLISGFITFNPNRELSMLKGKISIWLLKKSHL